MRQQLCEKGVVRGVEVIERAAKMLVGVGLVRPALHNLCNSLRRSFRFQIALNDAPARTAALNPGEIDLVFFRNLFRVWACFDAAVGIRLLDFLSRSLLRPGLR